MGAIESGLQLENLVSTVLATPRVAPPPATLGEARNAPGRDARIAEIQSRIEAEGIQYVYFQQVSVSGHVNGKGVVADFFAQVAKNGYQLVYGATADLFLDRHENYIGFGPLFATPTKPDYTPVGLAEIGSVHAQVPFPIFCIGGIKLENLEHVIAAGGERVVIVSGLLQAPDIAKYARAVKELLANRRAVAHA